MSNRVSLSVKVSHVTVKVSVVSNLFCAGFCAGWNSVELSASCDECVYSFYLGQGVSYCIRVMCLISLAGAARSIIFATKHIICHNKSMLVATKLLSWQNTSFSQQKYADISVVIKVLQWHFFSSSLQAYFCQDKRCVLSWQTHVCCNKHMFVMTSFVMTKMIFVAAPTNDSLMIQVSLCE